MRTKQLVILISILSLNGVFAQENKESDVNSPLLEGPYLGQKPPGLIPEVFAPGIVSTEHRDNSAFFSPDMKTFYFTRMDIETKKWSLMVYKYENDQWRGSVFGPRLGRPLLSPDGQVMHLGGKYMERTKTGWSEVKSHGPMIDRDDWGIMRLSASAKGTYVFDDYKNKDVIRISRLKEGKREEPQLLGKAINSGKWTAHPFIAPDESYLIWDCEREDGHGDSDLYISYRQSDGTWGEAINLGNKINSEVWEGGAYVTPDQKYIFFNRAVSPENTDIYWVDAKIIEDLRPKKQLLYNHSQGIQTAYFGEEPPGLVPKLFDPTILSPDGLFEGGKFTPDMQEYYFSRKNGKYKERTHFVIRYENGSWGNESKTNLKWHQFSKGGDTLYVGNKYRIRTDTGWSESKSFGTPFSDKLIMKVSFSDNGTSYFDEIEFDELGKPDTVGAISYSRLVNGKYGPRQKMGKEINTGTWIAHPHIAPDQSYLIWDVRREDGYGGSDIYISFRAKDGSWIPAINMGPQINTSLSESGARVTADGKYLFFTRGQWETTKDGSENWVGKSYWVNAQVIENLRPDNNR